MENGLALLGKMLKHCSAHLNFIVGCIYFIHSVIFIVSINYWIFFKKVEQNFGLIRSGKHIPI